MAKKTSKKRVHSGKRAVRKVARKTASKKRPRGGKGAKAGAGGMNDLAAVLPRMVAVAMRDRAREALEWSHQFTAAMTKDWPAERWTFQTSPSDGHALWTIGHLATAYSWFASLIDGKFADMPENYQGLFGYGSKPTGDVSAYPPVPEVMEVHARAYQRFLDAVDGLKPDEVLAPTAADSHGLCATRVDAVFRLIWHEGWHQGQLSNLRKVLGLPGVM